MKRFRQIVVSPATALAIVALLVAANLLPATPALAQDDALPPAPIQNDEGGPITVEGVMDYTNPLLARGVAQPLIILEDQAGFVDRNRGYIMPPESQVLGVINGDFFSPPFTFTVSLPIQPQAALRDVDNNGEEDPGVMTYAVAFWTNTFGDPYLERRDLQGGGWSTAYATTRLEPSPSGKGEVVGGQYLVWAPDDQQGFPSGFGEDGLLFTEDDPIVRLPAGYTIVDMDTDPFTFDRSAVPQVELYEPETSALDDYSDLSYPDAFDAMIDKMRKEYAFTEYKGVDWDALSAEFRPRFQEAQENSDNLAYRRALRDFVWSIPDGHVGGPTVIEDFREAVSGGLGISIRDADDGRVIVNFLTPGGPAEEAGIQLGAEILDMNGVPIDEYVDNTIAYSAPFSTEHFRRLQQLRYATRAPLGTDVEVTYRNPDADEAITVTLPTSDESASFSASSFNVGRTGVELPVEFSLLDNGLGYVKIYSFFENELLTAQLWEQMMTALNQNGIPALIIDMRQNSGGSGFLADQMAAYFFNDELELGNTGYYDEKLDDFFFDERTIDQFYLPDESLRYNGDVAVIVGPNCASACEFFTYDMTQQDRADIVGQYPTAGLGGSIGVFQMPDSELLQFTVGRAVDMNGNIHIEGKGVPPTVRVPVTEETLFYDGDLLLDTAVAVLTGGALPYAADEAAAAQEPAGDEAATAEPAPEATETPAVEPEATAAATATETLAPEATETPAVEPEATAAATATETLAPEATETPTAEPEPEATAEITATDTPTPEAEIAAPAGTTVTVTVESGRTVVRAEPSATGRVIGVVADGTVWPMLGSSEDGEWIRIEYGTDSGWILAAYAEVNE